VEQGTEKFDFGTFSSVLGIFGSVLGSRYFVPRLSSRAGDGPVMGRRPVKTQSNGQCRLFARSNGSRINKDVARSAGPGACIIFLKDVKKITLV